MKFLIKYDCGYGEEYEVVDAQSMSEAEGLAYEAWRDATESQAIYSAEELTDEIKEEYGIEDDE